MRLALLGLGVAILAVALPLTGFASIEAGWGLTVVAVILLIAALTPNSLRRRIPFGRTERDRDTALAAGLAALLREGNELATGLPTEHEEDAMDAAYSAAVHWATRVRDAIKAAKPTWVDLFLDDMFRPQYFATNAPRRSRLENWWERRLTHLRELLMRLE